jgi:hypothetical protein
MAAAGIWLAGIKAVFEAAEIGNAGGFVRNSAVLITGYIIQA